MVFTLCLGKDRKIEGSLSEYSEGAAVGMHSLWNWQGKHFEEEKSQTRNS